MCFLDLLSFRVIKKFFPNFFSHLRDRVLKQLVKNEVYWNGSMLFCVSVRIIKEVRFSPSSMKPMPD